MSLKLMLRIASLLAAFGVATVVAGDKKPFSREESVDLSATVEDIDPAERTLVLASAEGERAVIVAGPEVRNFDQIKVGDEVQLTYRIGIAAQVKPRGTAASAPEEGDAVSIAKPGEKPSVGAARTVATTVKIDSVDTSSNTVTFRRADGITRTVAIEDPDAQKFIRTLKPGDPVELTYTEATAVSVVPARR